MKVISSKRWVGLLMALSLGLGWLSAALDASAGLPVRAVAQSRSRPSGSAAVVSESVTSSDAARLLYESRRTGDPDLYTRLADGTGEVNLTHNPGANDPGSPGDYVWSPDGTKIAFTSAAPPDLPAAFVMNADGSNVVQIVYTPDRRQTGLAWSPDSTKLALTALGTDGSAGTIYVFDTVRSLVMNVANFPGDVDSSPSWSPDSARLAFMRGRVNELNLITGSDLFVTPADFRSFAQVQLTGADGIFDAEPAWSGSQIAFLRSTVDPETGDRGPADLYVMNADGTSVRNLSNDADDDRFFSWSPDGTRIAFSRSALPSSTLYVIDVAGGGLTAIDSSTDAARGVRWSPDGTKLTYFRVLTDQNYDAANVYIALADGSDTQVVGSGVEYNTDPDWSSDGARIAFTSRRNGTGSIDIVDADGTGRVDLTNFPTHYGPPKWQPPLPPMTDMVISALVSPLFVPSGSQVSYEVDIHNLGPNPAGNVVVTAQLPGGVTLSSITDDAGGTCTIAPGTSFECDFPTMAAGDVKTITLLATATGASYTPLPAVFRVASSVFDSDSSNNTTTVTNYIAAPPLPAPATCYGLTQLTLGGFASGGAFAFSRSGNVLGQLANRAFFYDGSMHDLAALLGAGAQVSFNEPGKALSEEGSVLAIGTDSSSPDQYAVLFDASGAHKLTLGGTFSLPVDINDAGQAIGVATTAAGEQHAFRYDHGTMTDLGTLGGAQSYPHAISENGKVAGDAMTAGGQQHAFLYDETGMHDLGVLPGGTWSIATAVNAAGQVAGVAEVAGGSSHAFLYDGILMRDLGVLPGGTHSEATFVNAAGQVAGFSNTSDAAQHAFFFDGSALIDLTPAAQTAEVLRLTDFGAVVAKVHTDFNSDAGPIVVYDPAGPHTVSLGGSITFSRGPASFGSFGVPPSITNASGAVAGSSLTAGDAERHAFLYDGTGLHDLNAPAGGFGDASGINGAGSVVGIANGKPFLYQGGVLSNLNDFTCGAGVVLNNTYGISDNGKILVADVHGYLYLLTPSLTPVPPPPSYPPQPPSPTAFPGPRAVASGRIAFESLRDGNSEIYVMNADGTGQTNLTHNAANDHDAVWSPDGSTIAFLRGSALFLMSSDGSSQRALVSSTSRPAWSPDGLKIAFSTSDGIGVIGVDGTNSASLTSTVSDRPDSSPVWSPDGTKIAFVSNRDGNSEIYVMNADGTGQANLTHSLGDDYSPAWSPDGGKIAFIHEYQIYVMNADGSNPVNVSHSADPNYSPVWSPDGRLAYYRILIQGPSNQAGVFVVNADGSGATQVSVYTNYDTAPDWSPDGQHLALTSYYREGNSEIYLINSDGTGPVNLTNNVAVYDAKPRWQPIPPPNTPVGNNVTVSKNGVTVTFSTVTAAGYTSITPVSPNSLTGVPGEYLVNADSLAFEIHTTATFTGPITLSFHVPGINNSVIFSALRVLHSEPPPVPNFVDRTIFPPDTPSQNFATRTVYARATSLGQFLVTRYKDTVDPVTTASLSPSPNAAGWNNANVTVTLTASDGPYGSGVQSLTYWTTGAQVVAQTTVTGNTAALTITTDGTTTVHFKATDVAVNVEAAKSIAVKIDRTAPVAHITAPVVKAYTLNQSVLANYHCTDAGGSSVASCAGPVADGTAIDTSSVGSKSFAVNALDGADNAASASVTYQVTYGIQALFDQTQATKSGLPIPIKLQLVDFVGANQSSAAEVVTALGVTRKSDGTPVALQGAGTAFTFDSTLAGYVFNLQTTGYAAGVYLLSFSAAGDPVTHTVQFKVK
ncbi:MAG TPA: hypothetical protein VF173_22100 [Thermoanaerobaculia bacterium]|nr:hypothetical protein [Thermoanaerobaculia bacterium]